MTRCVRFVRGKWKQNKLPVIVMILCRFPLWNMSVFIGFNGYLYKCLIVEMCINYKMLISYLPENYSNTVPYFDKVWPIILRQFPFLLPEKTESTILSNIGNVYIYSIYIRIFFFLSDINVFHLNINLGIYLALN